MDSTIDIPYKARLVVVALIIKNKMELVDEEVIEHLKDNIYLHYFVGYSSYKYKQAFAPSLFVEIRKRLGQQAFDTFTDNIIERVEQLKNKLAKRQNILRKVSRVMTKKWVSFQIRARF